MRAKKILKKKHWFQLFSHYWENFSIHRRGIRCTSEELQMPSIHKNKQMSDEIWHVENSILPLLLIFLTLFFVGTVFSIFRALWTACFSSTVWCACCKFYASSRPYKRLLYQPWVASLMLEESGGFDLTRFFLFSFFFKR